MYIRHVCPCVHIRVVVRVPECACTYTCLYICVHMGYRKDERDKETTSGLVRI